MKSLKITILAALMASTVAPVQAGFVQTLKAAAQHEYTRVAACLVGGAAIGFIAARMHNKKASKKPAAPKKEEASNKDSLLQRVKPYVTQPVAIFSLFAAAIAALTYWNK